MIAFIGFGFERDMAQLVGNVKRREPSQRKRGSSKLQNAYDFLKE